MYYIRGVVKFYNQVRKRMARPLSGQQKSELVDSIRQCVQRIEEICEECGISPNELPSRTRSAYYYLKNLEEGDSSLEKAQVREWCESSPHIDRDFSLLFEEVREELFHKARPKILVEYYPYSSVKSTIRNYQDSILVRVSDIFEEAPTRVKSALATILLCRLERLSCPPEERKVYRDYLNSPEVREAYNALRQARGMKIISGHKGRFYDLEESFLRVNSRYFDNQLPKPILTWSEKRTQHSLGHEDRAMNTVVISKSLDSENVPRYVLDYVMYHELLHIKHGSSYTKGREKVHGRAFREDEKRFARYKEVEEWLKSNRI